MMGWFGRLVGTEKAVNDILDKDNGLLTKFGGWVDDFNYTQEEQAQANADKRAWGIRQLDALAPFKVVQRILAFAATFLWVFMGINTAAAIWVQAFVNKAPEEVVIAEVHHFIDLVGPMKAFAMSDFVLWPVLTVYALYFSGGVVESIKNKIGGGSTPK